MSAQNAQEIDQKLVAVLLATYNGERYLEEQIESLLRQTHQNWILHVSDDGSTDSTLDILERYRAKMPGRLSIHRGPRQGFAANFLSMITDDSIRANYYAFCDQDDLWHADKLERAITWLQLQSSNTPALYCTRTHLISENGESRGFSPLFCRTPSFRNALVQSIAGGNTMVCNSALQRLVRQAGRPAIVSHDWWLYMLVSGCDGEVFCDSAPSIDYRQHSANVIGSNSSLRSRLKRFVNVLAGQYLAWNDTNLKALEGCRHLLSSESDKTLEHFARARHASSLGRVVGTLRSGVYRQGRLENIALLTAALLRKV